MTLHLYILRQLIFGVVFSVGGMMFIAIPGMMVSAVHRLGGAGAMAVLGYIPLAMLDLIPYLLPIGFMLAVVATYGRLAADSEWTAMCMAGISPYRLALPGLAVALMVAAGTHWLVSYVAPGMSFERRFYARQQIVEQFKHLAPGQTEFSLGDFYVNAGERIEEENRFLDVLIHIPPGDDEEYGRTILAEELTLAFEGRYMVVTLVNADLVHSNQDSFAERIQLRRSLDELFETGGNAESWRYQTTPRVKRMLAGGLVAERDLRKARFEVHYRYSVATTCILFLLLGMPTGLLLRQGTRLAALAVSIGYAFLYQLLSANVGQTLALAGRVPEWVGAWGPSGVCILIGVLLARRALHR